MRNYFIEMEVIEKLERAREEEYCRLQQLDK